MFLTIKLYLCSTELFEIEVIICIKRDLALNNLQKSICHKTQTTNMSLFVVVVTVVVIIFISIIGYHPPFSTQWTSPSAIYSSSYKYHGRLEGEEQLLIGIVLKRWRVEIALDHLTCYRNNGSQYYRWTISLFCIH